ncbi:MAG TPA: hypothetical protein VJJ22_01785 [Candidatus Paceibacterota bacterium]
MSPEIEQAISIVLYYIGPFILVPLALLVLWIVWHRYIQMWNTFFGEPWTLIEIVLPKEIFKSPRAMEVVAGGFNQGYAGNWWTKFWSGTIRTWFSLEMVSLGGQVHFYIRTLKLFKHLIESQIYAQYGDVEIREVEDYVHLVKYGREPGWEIWGAQQKLTKPDPYPIRTYVDYGLDNESLKEETKTDPISTTVEYLGSLGPNEYAFIQILVQATKPRYKIPGFWMKKGNWQDEGKDLIMKLTKQDKVREGELNLGSLKLSPGEVEVAKAVEKSLSKLGFDCGIRIIYGAKKEHYDLSHRLALKNLFTQYNTLNLNGFDSITTDVDSVLMNLFKLRASKERFLKTTILNAYRLRSYFYAPFKYKPFVLNTEELATIYHFPGGVITTAGLPRIESKKAEPPKNLPI